MTSETISRNLRRLRQQKNLTQEQLAQNLGVSVQSISRWECGNTLPDVMLLPRIARLYGVTVDDLYHEDAHGYPSYAQRLLAVYESTGRTEDFLAAEQEFDRIPPAQRTADDLRAWGVLYHYMMQYCSRQALCKLEQVLDRPNVAEAVYISAAQQKIALLCDLGKGDEESAAYDQSLPSDPDNPLLWVLCVAAHEYAGEFEVALNTAETGIMKYPENASLYVHAGDICRFMKRYEDAFIYWNKALKIDSTFLDAIYSMGFCYEELEQYDKAYQVWTQLSRELERRGMIIEKQFPAKMAEDCLKRR